jgi:hypothetical protein
MALSRLAYRSDVITVGTSGNLYVMHIHGRLTMEELQASYVTHKELIASGAASTGVLTIADENVPIPGSDVRQASSRMMSELSPHLLAGATVVSGDGFWASASRSFLTAVYVVAKQPCPTKAFASIADASGWLGPRIGLPPAQVLSAGNFVLTHAPGAKLPAERSRSA